MYILVLKIMNGQMQLNYLMIDFWCQKSIHGLALPIHLVLFMSYERKVGA